MAGGPVAAGGGVGGTAPKNKMAGILMTADSPFPPLKNPKGLSLEQIDILYQNTNAIHSVAYRRQLIAEDVHAADPEAIARVTSKVDQEHGLHGLRTTKSRDVHDENVDVEHKT